MMLAFASTSSVSAGDNSPAVVSIIIDDIGYRLKQDRQMIELPGKLTYAVLPNGPQAKQLANYAHRLGKEVILHMPMQSTLGALQEEGVLEVDMGEKEVVNALREAFSKVPHAVGMNNHQGSLLTRHPGHMAWVMKEMAKQDYFFIDSRTSKQSVAEKIAKEQRVRVLRRDVFLDHDVDASSIKAQFNALIKKAKENGAAIGIAHPHPETIAVLKELLPTLELRGIVLEPLSYQFQQQAAHLALH